VVTDKRLRRWLPLVVLAVGVSLPVVSGSGFDLNRYQLFCFYVMLAIGLNFAFGYGGQLVLGQPVVFAAAAYTAGLLSSKLNWEIWQTFIPGILAAIATGLLLALPSVRIRGWYLGIISFFAIAVMPDVISAFAPLTGGDSGLSGINPMRVGRFALPGWLVYELVLLTTAMVWLAQRNLVQSGWGVIVRTMRDHPVAASASGVNLQVTRAWVYLLNAIACGLVGVEFAHSQLYLSPTQFEFNVILLLIGGMFLGGAGTLWGPVLGTAIFQGISFWVGPFSILNHLFLGVGVLVTALAFKGGILETLQRLLQRLPGRQPAEGHVRESDVQLESASATPLERVAGSGIAVSVKGITKSFGGNQALRGVDLDLCGGRLLALIGPNGSGKTTLLNVVSGFIRSDKGSISFNGRTVARQTPAAAAHIGFGRTFQVPRLVDELTVLQNIELGLLGLDRQRVLGSLFRLPSVGRLARLREARARETCRFLGLPATVPDSLAGALPLGVKRIVEIGRVVAAGATVVCLDEPAAGLNELERRRLKDVLRALVASGRAVLLVEHNTKFVLEVCDEIVLLKDGAIVGRGTPGKDQMDPALYEYVTAYTV
jgi:branched-chain amino acid transport system permease protein